MVNKSHVYAARLFVKAKRGQCFRHINQFIAESIYGECVANKSYRGRALIAPLSISNKQRVVRPRPRSRLAAPRPGAHLPRCFAPLHTLCIKPAQRQINTTSLQSQCTLITRRKNFG